MIRLITTRRLADLTGDHDREATLNDDLLADLEEVTKERDAHAAESRQRGCDAAKWAGLYEQTIAERDQARAIAVDLEQQLAAATDGNLVRELREQRDRMAALADTMQAAAEAADIPIRAGLEADDYRAVGRALLDAISPPKADDTRRRIYLDGTGAAWIDDCQDPDGTQHIAGIDATPGGCEAAEKVRERTGGLRVIGATK